MGTFNFFDANTPGIAMVRGVLVANTTSPLMDCAFWVAEKANFKNGKEDGLAMEWNEDGLLISEKDFVNESEK